MAGGRRAGVLREGRHIEVLHRVGLLFGLLDAVREEHLVRGPSLSDRRPEDDLAASPRHHDLRPRGGQEGADVTHPVGRVFGGGRGGGGRGAEARQVPCGARELLAVMEARPRVLRTRKGHEVSKRRGGGDLAVI